MNKKYVGGKEASEILGVHQRTLYQWDEKGKIDTIRTDGGKRLYNVKKYLEEKECEAENKGKIEIKECKNLEELNKIKRIKINYARVSTRGQIDDLENQKKILATKYPENILITDIGSGINFNRKGIRKIIELAIEGKIEEVVVVYKDRLTRFGYELIEDIIKKYSEGKIKIITKTEKTQPMEELMMDVLQIMNVFVAKMNGLRKYDKIK